MKQYPRPTAARQGVHKFDVVGLTFVEGYPDNIHRMAQYPQASVGLDGKTGEGLSAVVIRNPANPHDANAIEVHVPSIGGMIGHVPRQIAAELAPLLDGSQQYRVRVWTRIDPNHPDKPGASVELKPVAS